MDGSPDSLPRLAAELDALRAGLLSAATEDSRLAQVHPANRVSAENLVHYVALRRHDVRRLQTELAALGLSSLGRAEAQVLDTIDAVRRAVAGLAGSPSPGRHPPADLATGRDVLAAHTTALLGEPRNDRRTRIMVTLPTEAATDAGLVGRLVKAGAEVVRVNCAHDDRDAWAAMIANVRRAERANGRRVTVTMDLAGPKLRTGPILPGPEVVRIRPTRDALGRPVTAGRAWLTGPGGPVEAGAVSVPVLDPAWLARRRVGERIETRDTRGSARHLLVTAVRRAGVLATLNDTAYLVPGTPLRAGNDDITQVAALPPREQRLTVHVGDELVLAPDPGPVAAEGHPARIGCTLPEVFSDARVGHRVLFDDGRIGGEVESVAADGLHVRITDAAQQGSRLGAAKGINLPDTTLRLPALTEADLADLPFVVEHADAVSLSFVRGAEDVTRLQRQLAAIGGGDLGIIVKVETVACFENLPDVLLTAMRSPQVGVMIARGDLAVEAGYVRLGEVQEEILWLCEAGHVPVIWATQVLDTLARTGRPSRAEVTDAAMSGRAECVMLNKGPFVEHAVAFLDDMLSRMADHQRKKTALLRQLHAWGEPAGAARPVPPRHHGPVRG